MKALSKVYFKRLLRTCLVARVAKLQYVARLLACRTFDEAALLTGANIAIDGESKLAVIVGSELP
jgi:hypothetical protein